MKILRKILDRLFKGRYKSHPEALIVSVFFNPQRSIHRTEAFNKYYDTIRHLNHHIVEIAIGDDMFQLPTGPNVSQLRTKNLLWHKESAINYVVQLYSMQPECEYKYVFWLDADVLFDNRHWLVDSVALLEDRCAIVQPFEYCVHMGEGEEVPPCEMPRYVLEINEGDGVRSVWRSFASNYATADGNSHMYDVHGHVGFAWGSHMSVLVDCPLYDRALVGGADHIIAHAAAGQMPHECISKTFTENIDEINEWSNRFYDALRMCPTTRRVGADRIMGYAPGVLYHIWHGDVVKREYYKRIKEFNRLSVDITEKDDNGLYITDEVEPLNYMAGYFASREILGDGSSISEAVTPLSDFGGGEFGGGGAGGTWEVDAIQPDLDPVVAAMGNFS